MFAVFRLVVTGENLLHACVQIGVDNRRMRTLILDSLPGEVAEVVAGLANAKVSITGTGAQVIDQAKELLQSPAFRVGTGAAIQTGAVAVGISEGVAVGAAAAFSEVIGPLAAAGFTAYALYEFGDGFYDYANQHIDDCNKF
jgi:hypothetical protein